jgi:serine/threonine-protein kinase
MLTCPNCSALVAESASTCPECGVPWDATSEPTIVELAGAVPRPVHVVAERSQPDFSTGEFLSGRYRVVSFLGRGGMGEIYQVEDLKLGQTVALKFLPEVLARNGAALARFHREVRLARQVSHPNVCRVFDVGEARGRPFLSMEFIKGEDLLSRLQRDGRLSPGKAVDIAWQLCAGLAAIHDSGVLHRDLKPSNVMIDDRGRVRITDFGVAALAGEASEERSGTPAYMAPEQAADGQVSVRSDLYSLGLVLYEVFSGRKAFERKSSESGHSKDRHTPVALASLVVDLDPTAERMILRCLEQDPRNRPSSAREVARAFFGDPLAAALAGGEVPSPEMVASAPGVGNLSLATGAACLAGVLLTLLMFLLLSDRFMAHRKIPLPYPPKALAGRARSLLAQIGYTEVPRHTAYGFELDSPKLERSAEGMQPRYWFWYRESPQPLRPASPSITPEDPPRTVQGEAYLVLDPAGRLQTLEVVPRMTAVAARRPPPDWTVLLRAAGLNPARIAPVRPVLPPPPYADRRAAWERRHSGHDPSPVRVEVASFEGQPISLRRAGGRATSSTLVIPLWINFPSFVVLLGLVVIVAMTRRHLRLGIADLNGAWRLAAFMFLVALIGSLFADQGIPTWRDLTLLAGAPALIWCSYLSFEPMLRRRWPARIVSWTRLLAGHARDPMVGRDLLVGCLLGLAFSMTSALQILIAVSIDRQPRLCLVGPDSFLGFPGVVRQLSADLTNALLSSLGFVIILLVLQQILRRERLAVGALAVASLTLMLSSTNYSLWLAIPAAAVKVGLMLFTWLRFGFLADLASRMVFALVLFYPLTRDPSDWYAGTTLFVLLAVSSLAVYGFAISTSGSRPSIRSQ